MADYDVQISLNVDNSVLAKEEMQTAIDRALEAIGAHIEGEAKEELSNAPKRIDTGLLRNSITYALYGRAAATSSYSGNTTHGESDATRQNGTAGKPAPPPHEGTYTGKAPGKSEGGMAVYIGSNVEYAA